MSVFQCSGMDECFHRSDIKEKGGVTLHPSLQLSIQLPTLSEKGNKKKNRGESDSQWVSVKL